MADHTFPPKDPAEKLPYSFDWARELKQVADTIAGNARVTSSDPVLTVAAIQTVGSEVRFILSGGVIGSTYTVQCEIDTTKGYVFNRAAEISVEDR